MVSWARAFGEYIAAVSGGVGVALIAALIALALSRVTFPALRQLWCRASPLGRLFGTLLFLVCSINATTKAPSRNAPKRVAASVTNQVVYSSDKTDCVLTVDDFSRGFVQTRIGTNETFNFNPPDTAETCSDWKAFGAAEDWFYLSLSDWAFPVGTNKVTRMRVHSNGRVDLWGGGKLLPLATNLGLTPKTSQFWHHLTPSNTLQLTWQNALYNRAAEAPVSIQAELSPNGTFTYRYDFSSLNSEMLTNILVGAAFSGKQAGTTNALPVNITSISYYPLTPEDAENPDRDEDGIPLIDELCVYGTDPNAADTDFDGLSDYDELFVYETDPLNPHSVNAALCDGFAVKLNGEDPFSYPQGSSNTVLEHLFYTGTTNGYITLPKSSDTMAVLRVAVSGIGSGELIVGDKVVPLLGETAAPKKAASRAKSKSSAAADNSEFLVELAKGVTYPLYLRADSSLSVSLSSSDFAFGVIPSIATGHLTGSINFPNTRATTPCIHDFYARSTQVTLPIAADAEDLTCTWQESEKLKVKSQPPRTALLTGKFSPKQTASVSYTLAHPKYLFGETTYTQIARYCPQPKEEDEDKPWYEPSGSGGSGGGSSREDLWACCRNNECSAYSPCKCGGCCVEVEVEPYEQAFDTTCPEHGIPYEECAYLHEEAYTNAVRTVMPVQNVLYIRDPLAFKEISLTVQTTYHYCCPCPSHSTNYVAASYTSSRLRLLDEEGAPFEKATKSCMVRVAGVSPSSAVGDAALAFVSNGETDQEYNFTILGVAIKHPSLDLAALNTLAPNFGLPLTVSTNLSTAAQLRLVTNIGLFTGNIHLSLENTTGTFSVWYRDATSGEYRKLLDSATQPTKSLSLLQWRALVKSATGSTIAALPVYVSSSQAGTTQLLFRYWDSTTGFLQDEVRQTLTSVLPPIRFDVNRDGRIESAVEESEAAADTFRYWINEDTVKGNYVGASTDYTPNAADLRVNGKCDLINFFPIALDFNPFWCAWGDSVQYEIKPGYYDTTNCFNYCFANVPWASAGKIYTERISVCAGDELSEATLNKQVNAAITLDSRTLNNFSDESGLMVVEALSSFGGMRVEIKMGNTILYSYSVPIEIFPVKYLYNWLNYRGLSGGAEVRTSKSDIWGNYWNADKVIIFIHGFNMSESAAEAWGDRLFKRLWLAGMNASFYNVAWRSDIGSAANYQENVSNAFDVAGQIASSINSIRGEKVIMAHSLGNIIASSLINDHGLVVSEYLMFNAAVPAEAYDASFAQMPQLVHLDWENYPEISWSANWHKLFQDDPNDGRRDLGWPGRFANVVPSIVNFYSSGDEVLELAADNDISILTGATSGYRQYAWHRQELWKGRALANVLGGTTWSGWNIEEYLKGIRKISVDKANQMSTADFKTNTVFYCYPPNMKSPEITKNECNAHLAMGIPALTPAMGLTGNLSVLDSESIINLEDGARLPNGIPTRTSYPNRWLHSDVYTLPYFYSHKLFEEILQKGNLR